MVWGTLSRSLEDGTVSAAPVTDAGLDEGYPMYVLPIANFLSMSEWSCHQDLLRRGMLKQFDESMRGRVIFCSHQWCSYSHPDPGGDQLEALQGVLRKLAAGQMEPRGNGIVEHAFKLKIGRSAKEWTALLKDAYIWFDFASMPQPLANKAETAVEDLDNGDAFLAPHGMAPHGDHRRLAEEVSESATTDAAETIALIEQLKRAVDSIPSYIERCAEMFVLVPSVKHADRPGETCDFNTWRQRGWCRMEFVSSRLCCANDIPVMVITSRERTPEYFNLCDTMRLFAGHGNFTVSDDKQKVAGVLEKMIEAKAVAEHEKGNVGMFRAYLTLSGTFLMGLPKAIEMPEGVSEADAIKVLMKWRDDATEKAWMAATGCSPLHIACGLGRTEAVREMLAEPAMRGFLNRKIGVITKLDEKAKNDKGMGAATIVETCKGMTPLAGAMLCGDRTMIELLVAAGAQPTKHEFLVGCMMGPAANLQAFLDVAPGFDINAKGGMDAMGSSPLHAVCMFGDASQQEEKIKLLLSNGAAPSLHSRNMMGFTPMSCLAANADANPQCVKVLVAAGAKADERDKPGLTFRTARAVMALMAKTKKYSNMSTMLDLFGNGRTPIHHAAHRADLGMLRALHEVGAPVHALDKQRKSAHELMTKSLPDSHAPELLADVLPTKEALKAWGKNIDVARAVTKLGGRHAQVLPHPEQHVNATPA